MDRNGFRSWRVPKQYTNCIFRGIAYPPDSCEHAFRGGLFNQCSGDYPPTLPPIFVGDYNSSSRIPITGPCICGRLVRGHFPRSRFAAPWRTRQSVGRRDSAAREARSLLRTNQAEPSGIKGSRRRRCDNQPCQSAWESSAKDAERCISSLVPGNPLIFVTTAHVETSSWPALFPAMRSHISTEPC